MQLQDWENINENHTISSDGASSQNFTTGWSHNQLRKLVECGPYLLETETYRTGGVAKIVLEGPHTCGLSSNGFICGMFRSKEPVEKRLDWLVPFSSTFEKEVDIEDIELSYLKIDELVVQGNYIELDELVQIMAVWGVSFELQSGILRYTFSIREKVPCWQDTLQILIEDMQRNNLDPGKILLGLV